jgi:NAD(P)-dependent dehydrogenase (short-subunit alcohol dehydrogenase family)
VLRALAERPQLCLSDDDSPGSQVRGASARLFRAIKAQHKKAALNMMTRTCAEGYARAGIYVNSVDTGWVTNEAPFPRARRMAEEGFQPPLDAVDGAARVLDPVFAGVSTGLNVLGKFLKDYREIAW